MKPDTYTNLDEFANVSVANFNVSEKEKLLKRLVIELKKDNLKYLDKFFELIDTFPYKNLRLHLIEQTIIPMMNKKTQEILKREALLRYKNKNEAFQFATCHFKNTFSEIYHAYIQGKFISIKKMMLRPIAIALCFFA